MRVQHFFTGTQSFLLCQQRSLLQLNCFALLGEQFLFGVQRFLIRVQTIKLTAQLFLLLLQFRLLCFERLVFRGQFLGR